MNILYLLPLIVLFSYNSAYGCKEFSDSVTSETQPPFKGDIFISGQVLQNSFPAKIIVSGFYYEQEEEFFISMVEVLRTDLLTPSVITKEEKLPMITFQLRDGGKGKILQEIKQSVFEGKIKKFYKDGSVKTFPAPSLLLVVFDLPENGKVQDLWVNVLSPTGIVIYSSPVCVSE